MSILKNHINTYADLTAYNADMSKDFPNISYIQGTDEVKWNKYDPDHIVAVYDVTSTSDATKLLGSNTGITYQIIDGVQQQSVQTTYTFDTLGEHTIKYKLTGTSVPQQMFSFCTSLTSVIIPSVVTSLDFGAFQQCKYLTSVIIPNTVTSFGVAAFQGCSRLLNIEIPSGVTVIPTALFNNCSTFRSLTIPSGVTGVGGNAFDGCTRLLNIIFKSITPPTLENTNAFTGTTCPIYVPAESVEAYKAATNWSTYASRIQAIPSV